MKKIFFSLLSTFSLVNMLQAQTLSGTVYQDSKVSNLLDEKRKLNSKITVNDTYKIQIYHGNAEGAKKTITDFASKFNDTDATIVYSTPNYKVWVGSYKNRVEVNKALLELKKTYDRALVIKPNK